MTRLEDETGRRLDDGAGRVEYVGMNMGHRPAVFTQEVEVGVAGEVVDGSAVAEVDVFDQAEFSECIERSVHRRLVDRRVGDRDVVSQIVGRRVITHRYERLDHGTAGFGHAATGGAKAEKDVIDGLDHAVLL